MRFYLITRKHCKHLLAVFFLANIFMVKSQTNLVPNGGFEYLVSHAFRNHNLYLAYPWKAYHSSPDVYARQSGVWVNVPKNTMGTVYPPTGEACAGYLISTADYTRQGILGVKLCESLQVGTRYYVSFKINPAYRKADRSFFSHQGMQFTVNEHHVLPYGCTTGTNAIVHDYAQFVNMEPVVDTGWTILKGSFVADSNYQYAYVGIFTEPKNAWHRRENERTGAAYFFIDDVCVSTDSLAYKLLPTAACSPSFDIDNINRHIDENDFCRQTFYTWTTDEQIQKLKKDGQLYWKSKSDQGEYSIYDLTIRDSELESNPLVQLLLKERFANKRYAWPYAWPTLMGWPDEKYGQRLLQVTLQDSAIIGKLDRYSEFNVPQILNFYDLKGRLLDTAYVLTHSHLIAAIYHMNNYEGKRSQYKRIKIRRTSFAYTDDTERVATRICFREFVLVNQSMVKHYTFDTTVTNKRLRREIAQLQDFLQYGDLKQKGYYLNSGGSGWNFSWPISEKKGDQGTFYLIKCFENDYYLFNQKAIEAIIKTMYEVVRQKE